MKNNQGFTLVEVIISIATLSVLCIIFLQLFVKASQISDASSELDQSVEIANTAIEILKAMDSVENIMNSEYLKAYNIQKTNNEVILSRYLDQSFLASDREQIYRLYIEIVQKESVDEVTDIGLYSLKCQIEKISENKILYEAKTSLILD